MWQQEFSDGLYFNLHFADDLVILTEDEMDGWIAYQRWISIGFAPSLMSKKRITEPCSSGVAIFKLSVWQQWCVINRSSCPRLMYQERFVEHTVGIFSSYLKQQSSHSPFLLDPKMNLRLCLCFDQLTSKSNTKRLSPRYINLLTRIVNIIFYIGA